MELSRFPVPSKTGAGAQASTDERLILSYHGISQGSGEVYTIRVEPPETAIVSGWIFFEGALTQGTVWSNCGSYLAHTGSTQPTELEEVARCKKRLVGFQKFGDGWYNGDGVAPSQVAIAMANLLLDQETRLASIASIFPAIEGGVLFEFKIGGWDYSIEINNKGELELLGVELDGPGEYGPCAFPGQNSIQEVLKKLKKVGM